MIRLMIVMTLILIAQVASAALVFRGTYSDGSAFQEVRATMTVSNAGHGFVNVFIDAPGAECVITVAPAPMRMTVYHGLAADVRVAIATMPVLNRCGLNDRYRSLQLVLKRDRNGDVTDATLKTPGNGRVRWSYFFGKAAIL